MNLKEMIAKARLIETAAPMSDEPLVNLWMREIDGVSRRWIIEAGVHGPDIAMSAAESSLKAGASEKAVLDALDECDRLYGLTDEESPARSEDSTPPPPAPEGTGPASR